MFKILDEGGLRDELPTFCAENMSRIPTIPDEMSDLSLINHELRILRQEVTLLSSQLASLATRSFFNHNSIKSGQTKASTDSTSSITAVHRLTSSSVANVPPMIEDVKEFPHLGNVAMTNLPDNDDDFAGAVKKHSDKEARDWKLVEKKKRHNKNVVIGQSATATTFKGVVKKSVVCINRLELGTTVDTVCNHLASNDIAVISCFEVKAPSAVTPKFTSMRLCVSYSDLEKVYNSNMWPRDVVVRPWKFKAQISSCNLVIF